MTAPALAVQGPALALVRAQASAQVMEQAQVSAQAMAQAQVRGTVQVLAPAFPPWAAKELAGALAQATVQGVFPRQAGRVQARVLAQAQGLAEAAARQGTEHRTARAPVGSAAAPGAIRKSL